MKTKNLAFTMAEILLSLTIIGVVAAITLPSLTGNINERTWNTQRKALYARMSQAMALMPALNGFGSIQAATSSTSAVDTTGQAFVTELGNVLKINNVCDNEHLEDCGINSKINALAGSTIDMPKTLGELNSYMVVRPNVKNTKAVAFETQNNESIVVYYNPSCMGNLGEQPYTTLSHGGGMYVDKRVCANFIYDLNGKKGPNTVGKDIGFMTVMYPFDALLYSPFPAPRPLSTKHPAISTSSVVATTACTNFNPDYRLPKGDELISMYVNSKLLEADKYEIDDYGYVASEYWNAHDGKFVLSVNAVTGFVDDMPANWEGSVWCIKR